MPLYRPLVDAFEKLGVDGRRPAIVHASLSSFGFVKGGAPALVAALLAHFERVIAPAFTYKTMLVPESGPPNNGVDYGRSPDTNRMAEFYSPGMPADRLIGAVPEALRKHPRAKRSMHPILSFTGVNAAKMLDAQTLDFPLAPIEALAAADGWVVLLGVNHRTNTSIHLGEYRAGRKTFQRWALTREGVTAGVTACPNFPPCSDGFQALDPLLAPITHRRLVGDAWVRVLPLRGLLSIVEAEVAKNPLALLCAREGCPRCDAIRAELAVPA